MFEDAVTWIIYVSNPKGLPKVAVVVWVNASMLYLVVLPQL
jgi:hypothetical protein